MKQFLILNGAKVIFSFSILLIFSLTTFAQLNETFNQHKINFYTGSENLGSSVKTRPRIYDEPSQSLTETAKTGGDTLKPEKKAISTLELERKAFDLLNQRRTENGLQAVVWNEDVARLARVHSQNMATNNFFSHQGLDGLMVDKRADAFGLKNWRRIGENIAYNRGYADPVEFAVLRWMQSEGHRQNLLSDKWKESGVGVAVAPDGKTYYFTQVFILRK